LYEWKYETRVSRKKFAIFFHEVMHGSKLQNITKNVVRANIQTTVSSNLLVVQKKMQEIDFEDLESLLICL